MCFPDSTRIHLQVSRVLNPGRFRGHTCKIVHFFSCFELIKSRPGPGDWISGPNPGSVRKRGGPTEHLAPPSVHPQPPLGPSSESLSWVLPQVQPFLMPCPPSSPHCLSRVPRRFLPLLSLPPLTLTIQVSHPPLDLAIDEPLPFPDPVSAIPHPLLSSSCPLSPLCVCPSTNSGSDHTNCCLSSQHSL